METFFDEKYFEEIEDILNKNQREIQFYEKTIRIWFEAFF
jgi:hypothetical protein